VTTEQWVEGLYQSHGRRVYAFLVGMVGDRHAAEDLAQEAFARALAGAHGFRPCAKPSTWLFAIARNLAINHLSRTHAAGEGGLDEIASGVGDPSDAAEDGETAGVVRTAVERLDIEHREVFLLKVIEGLAYREIGETLGIPTGTAQSRFHYAVREIRERLSRRGVEP
jgi:RNA polymerase sigma-70 factor (ECF subfamily)